MTRPLRPSDLARFAAAGATIRAVNPAALAPPAAPAGREAAAPIASRSDGPLRLIARFEVEGRAVPWSVPPKIRRKAPRLVAWQERVAVAASAAMGGREPWDGPFATRMEFRLVRRGPMPDCGNLAKAATDSLQGIIITNDKNQRREENIYDPDSSEDRVTIEVWTIGGLTFNQPTGD